MKERDIAIKIEGLKKRYRLGVIGGGTLQGDIQSWWARKRGKEDPNTLIGATVHQKNETFLALEGIDLTIHKGERIGIIGHNGAGKSTLLKLLSRVTAPTEGKIYIDGRIASMLEVGTGFNPELTGRENIYLNGAILGMTKEEVDKKIEEIIEFSECRKFIDTPVKRYSSGMYVKLAFSVAAHLDSEILIMDEVLAVGDVQFQKKCLSKMSEVSKSEGRTILYVSHNMNTIRQLCDRCIVLSHGKVVYDGDVSTAITKYLNIQVTTDAFVDLSSVPRANWMTNDRIRIKWIKHIVDSDSAPFLIERTKLFHINICLYSREKVDDLLLLFGIIDEIDNRLGGFITFNLSVNEGENVFSLKYDVSMLTPGRYKSVFDLSSLLDNGNNKLEDSLKCFSFDIIDTLNSNNTFIWNREKLGKVKLPETKAERINGIIYHNE